MALITVVDDDLQLAATAAHRVTALTEIAVAARTRAGVCLAGGHTPERLYQLLADEHQPWRERIDWSRIDLFWGDERHVPPHHPDSNFGMAYRTLLSRVPIPPAQIHRIEGERPDAREAARKYDAELHDRTFDVMLLGIGEDAHIASLFPEGPLLEYAASAPRVAGIWVGHLAAWRITLTPPALLDARNILVMAAGANKAAAVRAALRDPDDVRRYPAQLLRRAEDRVEWIIDRPAARWLDAPPAQ